MFRILCIFALWIGWFGHHPISGKSVAASTISMTDTTKSTDIMRGRKPFPLSVIKERLEETGAGNYDYSLVNENNYIDTMHKIPIVCKTCGLKFEQTPQAHLHGEGCPDCCGKKISNALKGRVNIFRRQTKCYGVGICDIPFSTYSSDKVQRAYGLWNNIIARSCNDSVKDKHKTYKDCSVCSEWLLFGNFLKWFNDPTNGYKEGYSVDKDILVKGNKVYSPDTCCFVPREINSLLTKSNATRGAYPIGVSKRGKRFSAHSNFYGKTKKLGMFDTSEEAFLAYKHAKEEHIKEMATQYYNEGKITEKVYEALMKYEVEITD
jgi:hypothetical protein